MPSKSSSNKNAGTASQTRPQSQSQSHSSSQSRSRSQSQGKRQNSYHGSRSTSFGEVQDPMLWMTRTPVPASTLEAHSPYIFTSRHFQHAASPYPTNVPAARGYLPSYQLSGARHQNSRSPPIPLYRRFPVPSFTHSTRNTPPLRNDPNRPYSATTYRKQQVSRGDGEDDVVLPPRPATTSDADLIVPPHPSVFPMCRESQESAQTKSRVKRERASQTSQADTTPEMSTRLAQQPGSQKQTRIILKNYKRVTKPLEGIQESTMIPTDQLESKPTPYPGKRDTTQAPERKQEEKIEYGEDDSTVTGSTCSSSSDDELALDLAQGPPTPKKQNLSTARKPPTPQEEISETTPSTRSPAPQKPTTGGAADAEVPPPKPEKRPCPVDACTQASATWLVSSGTQTAFEAAPKRPKTTASADAITAVLDTTRSLLEGPHANLDAIVSVERDVGALVKERLGDAGVLQELEVAVLVGMVVGDKELYEQVERMLG
ncbi:hypothetical protein F4810DRAFT_673641 [Camillea tinctor]|nr:hypothetical protein F4810DRAFT_673641 [Camillea tinctor]